MKNLLIAVAVLLSVGLVADWSLAADETQKFTGILIDAKCGKKSDGTAKNEEACAKHPAACALKCANGGEALTIVAGDKVYKLDDASKTKAIEYLTNEKGEGATRVEVQGTLKEDTLTISSIKKAEAKKAA
jgi:hypothetical protein